MKAQILLATHNPPPALFARQLCSLTAQTEHDWQCLILDDASTQRAAVAAALTDPRFVLLPRQPHLGPYRAFEALLSACERVPVFFCDQDDFWYPDKLRRLLATRGPAYSAMRVVDENGEQVRDRFLPPPASLTPAGLLLMNCVAGTSLKITSDVRAAALPFPAPALRGWHDQWLAAVSARVTGLTYVDEVLVDYTRHQNQVIGDGLRRIDRQRLTRFLRGPELRSRADWVRAAAYRLLRLPGPPDHDLQLIAAGQFRSVLRHRDVPVKRAVLLRAGRWLG